MFKQRFLPKTIHNALVTRGGVRFWACLLGALVCGGLTAFGEVVSASEVSNPVAVRYAFRSNPEGANLYNRSGLPGSPFRADTR